MYTKPLYAYTEPSYAHTKLSDMHMKLPYAYTELSYTHTKSPYSFAVGQSYPRRARCDYGHVGYNSRDVYAKPAGVLGQSAYLP
jgi:hypothetical protein